MEFCVYNIAIRKRMYYSSKVYAILYMPYCYTITPCIYGSCEKTVIGCIL